MIDTLLKPRQWTAPQDRRFFLSAEEISELCEDSEKIFKDEPTVLELSGELLKQDHVFLHGACPNVLVYAG